MEVCLRPSFARLSVVTLAVCAAGLGATSPSPLHAVVQREQRVDSVRTLREARQALRMYWHVDSYFVVRKWPASVQRPLTLCEQQLGPFCFGPRNGGVAFGGVSSIAVEYATADPAIKRISRKRMEGLYRTLLRKLDGYQQTLPGDRWIMGQRVLHRVERAELEDAAIVAETCRSDRWWCAALVGYTQHLLGDTPRADSAFAVALATMPPSLRCEWEDLSRLLEGDPDHGWYAAQSCAERMKVNERIWWLADPLYIEPGNERRSAHYFRLVHAALSTDAEYRWYTTQPIDFPDWYPRGPAFSALVVRMGVPSYVKIGQPTRPRSGPMFVLQFRTPFYHFIPALAAARAPLAARADDWTPLAEHPVEHMRPRFGQFSSLPFQVAYFHRGDSALVVAATDMLSDTLFQGESLVGTAVVMSKSSRDTPRILTDTMAGAHGMYVFRTLPESTLMSLEAVAAGAGAGRARLATGPPPMPVQRVTLSDMLMLESAEPLPATLEQAIQLIAPRTTVSLGHSIGLYWEVYGVRAGDSMSVSIAVAEHAPSGLGRLGQRLGIVAASDSVRIAWTAVHSGAASVSAQSIVLNLSELSPGTFTLRLQVAVPGQQAVTVQREIAIVQP